MRLGVFYNPDCEKHEGYTMLAEKPARLDRMRELFRELGLEILPSRPASAATIELAHDYEYIKHVRALSKKRELGQLGDFIASASSPYLQYYLRPMEGTFQAAAAAAGCVHTAVQAVATGELTRAFCAVRPPGHHAGVASGEGFCFFNNVAIGALAYAETRARVAIVDFDRHHGNGTQEIVEERGHGKYRKGQLMLVSSFLEGCKYARDIEGRPDTPNVVTIPIPNGGDFAVVKDLYETKALPAIMKFKPDLIMISAGFDMHEDDTLSSNRLFSRARENEGIKLKSQDFGALTHMLVTTANRICRGRIVSVLEGGYDLPSLKESARYHLEALRR